MLIFYLLIGLMIVIALFTVSRALLKETGGPSTNSRQASLELYQQRLLELQRDREAGVLSDEQSGLAQAELERSLLDEINVEVNPATGTEPQAKRTADRRTTAIVALLLPLLAGTLYFNLGQPELVTGSRDASSQRPDDELHRDASSIENMVEMLAQRMRDNPDDTKGWVMLSRSFMTLGRYREAADAYEHLLNLLGEQPDILISYADALAMANDRSFAGQPEELVLKALSLDPDNIIGLWLAGRAADEKAQYETAIDYWQRLLPLLQEDPKSLTEVRQMIKTVQGKLGIPATEQIALAATDNAPAGRPENSITVIVELDPELIQKTDQEDSLFVFAQAVNGPPMPLAAVRKQVRDLPLEVTLDDSMAMLPSQKLSSYNMVKISARISKSGNAVPQSGDLTATPVQTTVRQSDPISLIINTRIP